MQPEPKKHISHAIAWSLIALVVGLVTFGTWIYFNQISDIYDNTLTISISHKKTVTKPTTATTGSTATANATADWKTYEIEKLGLSFKYPKAWGTASVDNSKAKVETGYSYSMGFDSNSEVLAGFTSTDMSAGREGRFYEMISINKNVAKIKDCDSFKTNTGSESLTTCSNVEKSGKVIGMVVVYDFPEDAMFAGPFTIAYYMTGNTQFPFVGFEIGKKSSDLSTTFENIILSFSKV